MPYRFPVVSRTKLSIGFVPSPRLNEWSTLKVCARADAARTFSASNSMINDAASVLPDAGFIREGRSELRSEKVTGHLSALCANLLNAQERHRV